MPILAGAKSRFAILNIDNDSSSEEEKKDPLKLKAGQLSYEEHKKAQNAKKRQQRKKKRATTIGEEASVGLVKEEQIEDEHMKKAMLESRREEAMRLKKLEKEHDKEIAQSVKPQAPSPSSKKPGSGDKTRATNGASSSLATKAKPKVEQHSLHDFEAVQAECLKYKERYKKLCELLRETEIKEKAKLIVEAEKAYAVRDELVNQVEMLTEHLEQEKSKNRDFEKRIRDFDAKQ